MVKSLVPLNLSGSTFSNSLTGTRPQSTKKSLVCIFFKEMCSFCVSVSKVTCLHIHLLWRLCSVYLASRCSFSL